MTTIFLPILMLFICCCNCCCSCCYLFRCNKNANANCFFNWIIWASIQGSILIICSYLVNLQLN